ncbi:MAG TPA: phage holin family protein [Methylocella sp.]|nr:phage holin family protein [Methylocella sp.]
MNRLFNRLISEAIAPVEEMSTRLLKRAVLFFSAMGALLISAAFLTLALFDFVQPLEGNAAAALTLGGLYLVGAAICIFFAIRQGPREKERAKPALVEEDKQRFSPERAEFATRIDEAIAPILGVLEDAGMERERVAIQSGAELAKQLHPFSLVAFAVFAGLLVARVIPRGPRPAP